MPGKESIAEILDRHFGITDVRELRESEGEVRFRLAEGLRDPQTAAFRSPSRALDALAVSHRLSLPAGRAICGVPEDSGFAIKSAETRSVGGKAGDGCLVSLRVEAAINRHGAVTALTSTLVTEDEAEARTTVTAFNVMPASLVSFVRRSRQFLDFAEVRMSRDEPELVAVADDHFEYRASESDRLSDGRRVDHVPALTLIDLALHLDGKARQSITADFLSYADPRTAFDILLDPKRSAVEFRQNGRAVASVRLG
jgi:hypothetical protein